MGINGGTSCTNELVSEKIPERKQVNYFIEISPSGEYIVENYILSGGSALMNWYKNNFGACEVQQAEKEKRNVWEIIYGLAGDTPPGNRGMMVVPYFQGANGPYWDMTAKGVIAGLRQEYGRPYFVRGFIEGLAYESRRQMELMESGTKTRVQSVRMYGGSARSDHWNQVFTDVLNRPLHVPDTAETTALGAAISAAVGCGMYTDFRRAAEKMVGIRKSYKPVARNVSRYEKLYTGVYNKLYDQLHDLMREASEIIDNDEDH
jgi:xylulokinase